MSASIVLNIRLGPMVTFKIEGDNCNEILEALEGFNKLNQRIDEMCTDLGERMYPEAEEVEGKEDERGRK